MKAHPTSFRAEQSEVARLAAGLSGHGNGHPWPHDACRHTFATFAVALLADPGQVALWMGHQGNPTMLYTHYRGLATKAEAKRFWALRP